MKNILFLLQFIDNCVSVCVKCRFSVVIPVKMMINIHCTCQTATSCNVWIRVCVSVFVQLCVCGGVQGVAGNGWDPGWSYGRYGGSGSRLSSSSDTLSSQQRFRPQIHNSTHSVHFLALSEETHDVKVLFESRNGEQADRWLVFGLLTHHTRSSTTEKIVCCHVSHTHTGCKSSDEPHVAICSENEAVLDHGGRLGRFHVVALMNEWINDVNWFI